MNRIFIDTNIYLGFFNSNRKDFKKLLVSLNEIRDKILITTQIIDEIDRNKLKIFIHSINSYIKQLSIINTTLPEHFDSGEIALLSDWNKKRIEIDKQIKDLKKELDNILNKTVIEISTSSDIVSQELSKNFQSPLTAIPKLYSAAMKRREVGNPPGKFDDPLGDQLNWVQILDEASKINTLIIVTNDNDYMVEHNGQLFLNPLLHREIKNIKSDIEVLVFDKLSSALKELNKRDKIESLPPEKELEQISKQESILQLPVSKFYGGGFGHPINCEVCDEKDAYNAGAYLRSKYGGLTYQFVCKYCGHHYDTGEYWD